MTLWYDRAAANWDEALPLGNGRMGAMMHGGPRQEQLHLNDDTLWSGYGQVHELPNGARGYTQARDLALAGKYKEAQEIIERDCLAKNTQRFLPLGHITLEMPASHENCIDYWRELDIENAVSAVHYRTGEVNFARECFVSFPDQVLVMRLGASEPGAVTFTAQLACLLTHTIRAEGNRLILEGQADPSQAVEADVEKQGMKFIAVAEVDLQGGTARAQDGALYIEGADSVVIRMAWRTNFKDAFTPPMLGGVDYRALCEADLAKTRGAAYAELKTRHLADYHALYKRVEISFAQKDTAAPELPLPERLARWETAEDDAALFALLFQYGRYLTIAASRPGSMPMNLQGIWSHHFWPPWSGNYTLNINAEMNYWPTAAANLAECHEPLTRFVRTLRKTGARTAQAMYGARGFVAHHNSDIWGMSTPVQPEADFGAARWAFWPLAGGWLAGQLYNQYLYNRDEKFLWNEVMPAVRDAARFFLDVMVEDADGTLIFAPSTSPENDFSLNGDALSVSKTATMTTAIIRETLENYIAGCLMSNDGDCGEFWEEAEAALARLPAYKIGAQGDLLEWSEDLPAVETTHRHTSHLYPLYPGRHIEAGTPLAAACRRTLDLRGDESTGWALAWRINLFARLHDAERAFSFLKMQLRPSEGWRGGCYPNLFGSHPPFQIDSNFGATAGMTEMLLQSTPGNVIHLLPALPRALGTGHVRGLRAMGGVTVDMSFANGKLTQAELTLDAAQPPQEFTIIYEGTRTTLALTPGVKTYPAWF